MPDGLYIRMAHFKKYLESEEKKDIKRTLEKIPERHALLVKDYEIVFQPNNTLKGDEGHILGEAA